jgi:Mor family transcriptional regulator
MNSFTEKKCVFSENNGKNSQQVQHRANVSKCGIFAIVKLLLKFSTPRKARFLGRRMR